MGYPRAVQIVAVGGGLEVAQDVDGAAEVALAHAGRERASPEDRAPVSDGHTRRRRGLELCSQLVRKRAPVAPRAGAAAGWRELQL